MAIIQLAIVIGATAGGALYDYGGYCTTFSGSAIASLLAVMAARAAKAERIKGAAL